jgi:hypothetical protein
MKLNRGEGVSFDPEYIVRYTICPPWKVSGIARKGERREGERGGA